MCGIAGIIHFNNNGTIDKVKREDLEVLQSLLLERGPDTQGTWIGEGVGLVHTRLSILDLSTLGSQPMTNPQKNVVFSYNGEVYNFKDIRKELQEEGISFSSESDTEVILHGYSYWGIEGLSQKLEGMFAFALYDKLKGSLDLARDRWGQKPLYYYFTPSGCTSSSDIRGIHKLHKKDLTLDWNSLDYYLSELSSPQPQTIWEEVKQVRPAHFLEFTQRTGKYTESGYWELPVNLIPEMTEVEELLSQAILKQTISDVPLGCFLSGGVDSGLIVSLLAANSSKQIQTFTVGFVHDDYNELGDARPIANRYNTIHHEIELKPEVLEILPKLISYFGEPFADSSMIPTYHVSKSIRSFVSVALSRDGGMKCLEDIKPMSMHIKPLSFGMHTLLHLCRK